MDGPNRWTKKKYCMRNPIPFVSDRPLAYIFSKSLFWSDKSNIILYMLLHKTLWIVNLNSIFNHWIVYNLHTIHYLSVDYDQMSSISISKCLRMWILSKKMKWNIFRYVSYSIYRLQLCFLFLLPKFFLLLFFQVYTCVLCD